MRLMHQSQASKDRDGRTRQQQFLHHEGIEVKRLGTALVPLPTKSFCRMQHIKNVAFTRRIHRERRKVIKDHCNHIVQRLSEISTQGECAAPIVSCVLK